MSWRFNHITKCNTVVLTHKKNTYCCFKSQFLLQATHPPFLTHTPHTHTHNLSLSVYCSLARPAPPPMQHSLHPYRSMQTAVFPSGWSALQRWWTTSLYSGHFSPERNSRPPVQPETHRYLSLTHTHTHTGKADSHPAVQTHKTQQIWAANKASG